MKMLMIEGVLINVELVTYVRRAIDREADPHFGFKKTEVGFAAPMSGGSSSVLIAAEAYDLLLDYFQKEGTQVISLGSPK